MSSADVVRLVIIGFELCCGGILAGLMARACGSTVTRMIVLGVEILAFMVLAWLPKPRPARHRLA